MGFIVKGVKSIFKAVSKVVKGVIGVVTKVFGGIFGFGVKQPKSQASNVNNLNKSVDPEAARKIVFGKIAAPLDVRFWEVWGSNATNFDEIIAHAGHQINSYQELYIEDKLAINAAGAIQSGFTGVLTRTTKLGAPGQTALSAGSGSLWTSTATFDGVAHSKLAWIVDEKKLPNGIPSRYTQVIEGALLYDPRRDSSRGGSGTHRADDQTTWAYATLDGNGQPIGRNNALQALWYLLGWRYAPRNRIGDQNFNNWGQGGLIIGAQDAAGFYPLTDDNAAVDEYVIYGALDNFANGEICSVFVRIKKDNVGKATRFSAIQSSDNTSWIMLYVDTMTGEFKAETLSANPVIDAGVTDGGDCWICRIVFKAVGAGPCATYIKPAAGAGVLGSAGANVATQGTASFRGVAKYLGNFDNPNGQLVCGRGVLPEDINFASFIAGANACETAGYYTDMNLSTEDEHTSNEDKITCGGLIARLIDPGGLWSYYANIDDTASIAVTLTDKDIIQGSNVHWLEYKGMSEQFNQVVGKYVMPSSPILYQPFSYPMVRDATYEANLGKKVRKTQDYPQVLDGVLAQRLSRLKLNAAQYQGEFNANWNMRAIKAQAWSVVQYQSDRFGWTKLFRVWRHEINPLGGVGLQLREIHSSIWTAGTTANAQPTASGNNALAAPSVTNLTAQNVSISSGFTPTIIQDAISLTWDAPPVNVRHTEIRYKVTGSTLYHYLPSVLRNSATGLIIPLVAKGTNYTIEARHITDQQQEGTWATLTITAGVAGNVVTANSTVIGMIDPATGRISNPTMYNTQQLLSIINTTNITVTYTVGGSNVTVNIPAHTRKVAGPSGPITLNYAAGSGVVAFSSYWIAYVDDAGLDGEASPTYVFTSDPNQLLYPNRYFVSSGTAPAAGGGGGSSGGGGGGGGGFGDSCVDAESYMPNGLLAKQVKAGDVIEVLDYLDFKGYCEGKVERNSIVRADCVRLISESGISVVCSRGSPCTLFGGATIAAEAILGHSLAVRDKAGFRWEQIVKVENVGERKVAHIYCNQGTYAAGEQPNKFIYTHNPKP